MVGSSVRFWLREAHSVRLIRLKLYLFTNKTRTKLSKQYKQELTREN